MSKVPTAPRVKSQRPQPLSSGAESEYASQLEYKAQYIIFTGRQGKQKHSVEVLAGDGAPTPSAGYAKWAKIPRPQRKSLTILEGYEPFTLSVPILFDAVRAGPREEDIEEQVQWLEWMGGRGLKFKLPYVAAEGQPPTVEVYTVAGSATPVPLVARPFQTILWWIEDIVWDEHPIRNYAQGRVPFGSGELLRGQGVRLRQAAVVKLVEKVRDPAVPEPTREAGNKVFHAHGKGPKAQNTVHNILAANLVGSRYRLGEAERATIQANKGNRAIGTNPNKPLKEGTRVLVPTRFL